MRSAQTASGASGNTPREIDDTGERKATVKIFIFAVHSRQATFDAMAHNSSRVKHDATLECGRVDVRVIILCGGTSFCSPASPIRSRTRCSEVEENRTDSQPSAALEDDGFEVTHVELQQHLTLPH